MCTNDEPSGRGVSRGGLGVWLGEVHAIDHYYNRYCSSPWFLPRHLQMDTRSGKPPFHTATPVVSRVGTPEIVILFSSFSPIPFFLTKKKKKKKKEVAHRSSVFPTERVSTISSSLLPSYLNLRSRLPEEKKKKRTSRLHDSLSRVGAPAGTNPGRGAATENEQKRRMR